MCAGGGEVPRVWAAHMGSETAWRSPCWSRCARPASRSGRGGRTVSATTRPPPRMAEQLCCPWSWNSRVRLCDGSEPARHPRRTACRPPTLQWGSARSSAVHYAKARSPDPLGRFYDLRALQLVLSAFLVIYLVTVVGHDLVSAGALLGLSQVAGVLGRILWGYVADRVGSPRKLLGLVGVGMALGLPRNGVALLHGPALACDPGCDPLWGDSERLEWRVSGRGHAGGEASRSGVCNQRQPDVHLLWGDDWPTAVWSCRGVYGISGRLRACCSFGSGWSLPRLAHATWWIMICQPDILAWRILISFIPTGLA